MPQLSGNRRQHFVVRFPKGTQWFLALSPRVALRDGLAEFALSMCEAQWMPVTEATRGKFAAEIRSIIKRYQPTE